MKNHKIRNKKIQGKASSNRFYQIQIVFTVLSFVGKPVYKNEKENSGCVSENVPEARIRKEILEYSAENDEFPPPHIKKTQTGLIYKNLNFILRRSERMNVCFST